MSSVNNYMFENLSRLGDDVTTLSEKNIMNSNFGSYNTTNFFNQRDCLQHPINIATSQPNIFMSSGKNSVGLNGCAVDEDSSVRIHTMQTNEKGRVNLYTRPFLTVPYLGRGASSIDDETRLKQGDYNSNRKTATNLSEEPHVDHSEYPLIDSIRHTVTNPNNLVESSADKSWIRGGVPSRELQREKAQTSTL